MFIYLFDVVFIYLSDVVFIYIAYVLYLGVLNKPHDVYLYDRRCIQIHVYWIYVC